MDLAVHALLGLLPVLSFLAALLYLDSYKLVNIRWVIGVIGAGSVTAIISYPLNSIAIDLTAMDFSNFTRYVSPFID